MISPSPTLRRVMQEVGVDKIAHAIDHAVDPDGYSGTLSEILEKGATEMALRMAARRVNQETRTAGLLALCHYRTL